jgi:hypothetical protein
MCTKRFPADWNRARRLGRHTPPHECVTRLSTLSCSWACQGGNANNPGFHLFWARYHASASPLPTTPRPPSPHLPPWDECRQQVQQGVQPSDAQPGVHLQEHRGGFPGLWAHPVQGGGWGEYSTRSECLCVTVSVCCVCVLYVCAACVRVCAACFGCARGGLCARGAGC